MIIERFPVSRDRNLGFTVLTSTALRNRAKPKDATRKSRLPEQREDLKKPLERRGKQTQTNDQESEFHYFSRGKSGKLHW